MRKAIIIGSGFAGLSAACFLAKAGVSVTVVEKNATPGGRASQYKDAGFVFDKGPSWYWMPDVFEKFFANFDKRVSDYYDLVRLDPSYRVYWPDGATDMPAEYSKLRNLFEEIEPGAAKQLDKFLEEAVYKYETGINKLVYKPGISLSELVDMGLIKGVLRLDVFSSMQKHVRKFFKHPKLVQLLEFPVLFLGATAAKIPALYSLMNYADIKLGTWYPKGGMYKISEAFHALALELGVRFCFEADVTSITLEGNRVTGIEFNKGEGKQFMDADVVISNADMHFTEMNLLPEQMRSYSEKYWQSRTMAPGCLLYFVGIKKKLSGLQHHTLFFDTDAELHANEIYEKPAWPENPLFYVSAVSVTDEFAAPAGNENLFFLIPVAAGLQDDDEILRDKYFELILKRFEEKTGHQIKDDIVVYRSYALSDFSSEYNAFKGNAYGLANTLMQTANLKPSCKSKKVSNLFYTGQLTVPGPGVPPAIISGEVVAKLVNEYLNTKLSKAYDRDLSKSQQPVQ